MRSYDQFCPLAQALDVVGERWTLLIIRELFARESRYSDLRDGLPGIATNLLAERLRHLEAHDVIESYQAPRPVGTTVYRLTGRGRQLLPAIQALASWGAPLLAPEREHELLRTHWMHLGIPVLFDGIETADLAPLTAVIRVNGEAVTIRISQQHLTVVTGEHPGQDAVIIEGRPEDITALVRGTESTGATISGPQDQVERLHTLLARSRLATELR